MHMYFFSLSYQYISGLQLFKDNEKSIEKLAKQVGLCNQVWSVFPWVKQQKEGYENKAAKREYECPSLEFEASEITASETLTKVDLIAHTSPNPPSLCPYSQPSSPVSLLGWWMTVASHGSSACCWAPSGFSSARWCWPGASVRSPVIYPETGGEHANGEKQGRERRGNVWAGLQNSFQLPCSHQHIWYAWLNEIWDKTANTHKCMGWELLIKTICKRFTAVASAMAFKIILKPMKTKAIIFQADLFLSFFIMNGTIKAFTAKQMNEEIYIFI